MIERFLHRLIVVRGVLVVFLLLQVSRTFIPQALQGGIYLGLIDLHSVVFLVDAFILRSTVIIVIIRVRLFAVASLRLFLVLIRFLQFST